MTPDQLFTVCNSLALFGWILLVFFTFWKKRTTYLYSVVVVLLCIVYAWLIFSTITADGFKRFGSLDGISQLFSDKSLLLAGWVHYLAFDLFTGIFILTDSRKIGINHWIIAPVLFLTFMLGPVGLLLYFLIKLVKTKTFLQDNF